MDGKELFLAPLPLPLLPPKNALGNNCVPPPPSTNVVTPIPTYYCYYYYLLCWELDEGVNLVAPVSVVGEPLEVDDEVAGQGPEVKLLGGLLVAPTLGAVPRVLLAQLFRFSEQPQTVVQLQHRALLGVAETHCVVLLHVLQEVHVVTEGWGFFTTMIIITVTVVFLHIKGSGPKWYISTI